MSDHDLDRYGHHVGHCACALCVAIDAEPPAGNSALLALQRENEQLKAEIAAAREACPIVRRQDYFDAPLLALIEQEISQLSMWQSRAQDSVTQRQADNAAILALLRAIIDRLEEP